MIMGLAGANGQCRCQPARGRDHGGGDPERGRPRGREQQRRESVEAVRLAGPGVGVAEFLEHLEPLAVVMQGGVEGNRDPPPGIRGDVAHSAKSGRRPGCSRSQHPGEAPGWRSCHGAISCHSAARTAGTGPRASGPGSVSDVDRALPLLRPQRGAIHAVGRAVSRAGAVASSPSQPAPSTSLPPA
jgi:hypothetical protein